MATEMRPQGVYKEKVKWKIIRNENVRDNLKINTLESKLTINKMRWCGHVLTVNKMRT
jgi:hypothetical protein